MLIDAAVDGQGVALARTTLAAWDLLHGRLVVPIDVALPLENTYWIIYPKLASREPKVITVGAEHHRLTLRQNRKRVERRSVRLAAGTLDDAAVLIIDEAVDDERRLLAVVGKGAGAKR